MAPLNTAIRCTLLFQKEELDYYLFWHYARLCSLESAWSGYFEHACSCPIHVFPILLRAYLCLHYRWLILHFAAGQSRLLMRSSCHLRALYLQHYKHNPQAQLDALAYITGKTRVVGWPRPRRVWISLHERRAQQEGLHGDSSENIVVKF